VFNPQLNIRPHNLFVLQDPGNFMNFQNNGPNSMGNPQKIHYDNLMINMKGNGNYNQKFNHHMNKNNHYNNKNYKNFKYNNQYNNKSNNHNNMPFPYYNNINNNNIRIENIRNSLGEEQSIGKHQNEPIVYNDNMSNLSKQKENVFLKERRYTQGNLPMNDDSLNSKSSSIKYQKNKYNINFNNKNENAFGNNINNRFNDNKSNSISLPMNMKSPNNNFANKQAINKNQQITGKNEMNLSLKLQLKDGTIELIITDISNIENQIARFFEENSLNYELFQPIMSKVIYAYNIMNNISINQSTFYENDMKKLLENVNNYVSVKEILENNSICMNESKTPQKCMKVQRNHSF